MLLEFDHGLIFFHLQPTVIARSLSPQRSHWDKPVLPTGGMRGNCSCQKKPLFPLLLSSLIVSKITHKSEAESDILICFKHHLNTGHLDIRCNHITPLYSLVHPKLPVGGSRTWSLRQGCSTLRMSKQTWKNSTPKFYNFIAVLHIKIIQEFLLLS